MINRNNNFAAQGNTRMGEQTQRQLRNNRNLTF